MQGVLLEDIFQEESKNLLSQLPHSERGAVYTKHEVVDFMLELTLGGPWKDEFKLLEPSFGSGNFLFPIISRVLRGKKKSVESIENAIRAYELSSKDYMAVRSRLHQILEELGYSKKETEHLASAWLIHADFLLTTPDKDFTHIVGNPPYLRIEKIPVIILERYREKFSTLYDRADVYVAFFEHCLSCLQHEGVLTFICADRWMKSQYGVKLRELVTSDFSLQTYIDLCAAKPFESDVTTYPAIFSIVNSKNLPTFYPSRQVTDIAKLVDYLPATANAPIGEGCHSQKLPASGAPMLLSLGPEVRLLRRIEEEHPLIEEVGCSVSIGVASGADKVFVGKFVNDEVEAEVLIPLLKGKDVNSGHVVWSGNFLLNPYEIDGSLRNLDAYPRLRAYLLKHKEILSNRHCVKRNTSRWYRTIDKIHPDLAGTQKLLVPDIRSKPEVVIENGQFYPHHNLYYIVSNTLNLSVLANVLNANIMRLFINNYSTPMQGGCYRFQAQHLRKIRIPHSLVLDKPSHLPGDIYEHVQAAYSLTGSEIDLLRML